jgi:uncharacterized protein (DUF2141 family)
MKMYLVGLVVLAVCGPACAGAAELIVTVTDIRVAAGTIRIGVVDSEAAWNNEAPPVAAQTAAASGSELNFRFTDLPPGTYAVRVMHDENDNGELDKNFMGLPTEGYGFSNNSQVKRRVRFDEAQFAVANDDTTVTVRLR